VTEHTRPAPAPVPGKPPQLRVLLVEDDAEIRESASELLNLLGHEVVEAPSAERARAALATGSFDVLLTDVTLPGMSGIELAREVMKSRLEMRVIIASGYGGVAAAEGEERLHGVVLLPKPYALPQLQQALEQVAASR
jgi:DNA-binding NtrC family response regulator